CAGGDRPSRTRPSRCRGTHCRIGRAERTGECERLRTGVAENPRARGQSARAAEDAAVMPRGGYSRKRRGGAAPTRTRAGRELHRRSRVSGRPCDQRRGKEGADESLSVGLMTRDPISELVEVLFERTHPSLEWIEHWSPGGGDPVQAAWTNTDAYSMMLE